MFPANSAQVVLNSSNSNSAQVEVLPVLNANGSVVILISNHAWGAADNNGKGLTAKSSVDVSALGPFTSASQLMIDSTTSVSTGPSPVSISPLSPIAVTINGYGTAILKVQ